MDFIAKNWQLIFGGVGTAVVAAVVAPWAKSFFEKAKPTPKKEAPTQNIQSGGNSTNIQSQGDVNIGTKSK